MASFALPPSSLLYIPEVTRVHSRSEGFFWGLSPRPEAAGDISPAYLGHTKQICVAAMRNSYPLLRLQKNCSWQGAGCTVWAALSSWKPAENLLLHLLQLPEAPVCAAPSPSEPGTRQKSEVPSSCQPQAPRSTRTRVLIPASRPPSTGTELGGP